MSASNTSSALVGRFSNVINAYGSREASAPAKAPQGDQSASVLQQIAARLAHNSRQLPRKGQKQDKVNVQLAPAKKSKWVFSIEYDAYNRPSRVHATPVEEPVL